MMLRGADMNQDSNLHAYQERAQKHRKTRCENGVIRGPRKRTNGLLH